MDENIRTQGFVWICFGGIATDFHGFSWWFKWFVSPWDISEADHFTIIDRSRASGWKRGGIKDQVAGESRGAMGPEQLWLLSSRIPSRLGDKFTDFWDRNGDVE